MNLKSIIKKTLITISITLLPTLLNAADVTIEMLNKLGKESMVYSQKIVKVNSGDTVFWKATTKGHNVEFIKGGFPNGVEKFKSKMNKDAEYKFTVPGIYAYWCTPHKSMGMIGFVVKGGDEAALSFMRGLEMIYEATSLGGVESLVECPFNSSHMMIPEDVRHAAGLVPGYVRMSIGIEDIEDLWADIERGFANL